MATTTNVPIKNVKIPQKHHDRLDAASEATKQKRTIIKTPKLIEAAEYATTVLQQKKILEVGVREHDD
ncbi:hypothetical protein H2198_003652 [Neophaeococcomyces mojaviensis]|uniref:Uncharacterized protein n=1 Tax=Neophaeococcomyces mojaviensis TaxID=3383035 RepID=A0ACC3AB62_9EURO|nr:hypothetical protein H2198_003652 [Knufia sp. JES_112]